MADEFSLKSVKEFIINKGGKVTNHELVKHFKVFLNDPDRQKEVRALFKEYVNTIAIIKQEEGIKYLALKPEFYPENQNIQLEITTDISECISNSSLSTSKNDTVENIGKESPSLIDNLQLETPITPIVHSHSSPSILKDIELSNCSLPLQDISDENSLCSESYLTPGKWYVELPEGEAPLPPPRRKGSAKGKETRDAKIQERMQLLCEEKEVEEHSVKQEINNLALSPGSVKERAKSLNKMASECDLTQKINGSVINSMAKKREGKNEKGPDDDDSSSVSTMDSQKKEWILNAAKADYISLVKLLKEEPKLAHFKDFISTALHWAAKHGNADIVKLIAGTHRVNPNIRSGYTSLHLAAMFCHEEIMEILIHSYGADPNLRDYNGKKPHQYLSASISQQYAATTNYCIKPSLRVPDVSFMRMGSLNAKVQKTTVASGKSNRLTRLKSWGSADNLSDLLGSKMMPPPKSAPPKKKKLKKPTTDREIVISLRNKNAEYDSDSMA